MPLVKAPLPRPRKGIGANIKAELAAGKPKPQAIAIAMRVAASPSPRLDSAYCIHLKSLSNTSSRGDSAALRGRVFVPDDSHSWR